MAMPTYLCDLGKGSFIALFAQALSIRSLLFHLCIAGCFGTLLFAFDFSEESGYK